MHIGKVGTENCIWGNQNSMASQKAGDCGFGDTVRNAAANHTSNHLVLHGFKGEKTENGDTVVGAWGDAIAGASATVYKPQDFDENDPVYRIKIWDKNGNVTERTVNLNEVDPQHCDSFEMYAYTCYASDSGKYPSAMEDFMMSHAHYQGELGGGTSYNGLCKPTDWLAVVKDIMMMQYQLSNMQGYLRYKGFLDFLGGH